MLIGLGSNVWEGAAVRASSYLPIAHVPGIASASFLPHFTRAALLPLQYLNHQRVSTNSTSPSRILHFSSISVHPSPGSSFSSPLTGSISTAFVPHLQFTGEIYSSQLFLHPSLSAIAQHKPSVFHPAAPSPQPVTSSHHHECKRAYLYSQHDGAQSSINKHHGMQSTCWLRGTTAPPGRLLRRHRRSASCALLLLSGPYIHLSQQKALGRKDCRRHQAAILLRPSSEAPLLCLRPPHTPDHGHRRPGLLRPGHGVQLPLPA
jgi:hypothetical protein